MSGSWIRAQGSKLFLSAMCLSLIALTGWNFHLQQTMKVSLGGKAATSHHLSKRGVPQDHLTDPSLDWDVDPVDPVLTPDTKRAPKSRGGAIYTHWGVSKCTTETDVELVYEGVVGGSSHDGHGGGSNYLCLPRDPEWNLYTDTLEGTGKIYGTEFETDGSLFDRPDARSYQDHDPVCAVCRSVARHSQVMIPAKRECPLSWTKEYEGYLMAGHYGHPATYEFICVDKSPLRDPEGYRNDNGALLYHVQAVCGSLPCPNYIQGRELTCVVCTK